MNSKEEHYTYDIDKNLLILFEYVRMINNYLELPKYYSEILQKIEFKLDKEIFKKPSNRKNKYLIAEKLTITDTYEC